MEPQLSGRVPVNPFFSMSSLVSPERVDQPLESVPVRELKLAILSAPRQERSKCWLALG